MAEKNMEIWAEEANVNAVRKLLGSDVTVGEVAPFKGNLSDLLAHYLLHTNTEVVVDIRETGFFRSTEEVHAIHLPTDGDMRAFRNSAGENFDRNSYERIILGAMADPNWAPKTPKMKKISGEEVASAMNALLEHMEQHPAAFVGVVESAIKKAEQLDTGVVESLDLENEAKSVSGELKDGCVTFSEALTRGGIDKLARIATGGQYAMDVGNCSPGDTVSPVAGLPSTLEKERSADMGTP